MSDEVRFTGTIMERARAPYAVIESPNRPAVYLGGLRVSRDDEAGTATINLGGLILTGRCLRHNGEV